MMPLRKDNGFRAKNTEHDEKYSYLYYYNDYVRNLKGKIMRSLFHTVRPKYVRDAAEIPEEILQVFRWSNMNDLCAVKKSRIHYRKQRILTLITFSKQTWKLPFFNKTGLLSDNEDRL